MLDLSNDEIENIMLYLPIKVVCKFLSLNKELFRIFKNISNPLLMESFLCSEHIITFSKYNIVNHNRVFLRSCYKGDSKVVELLLKSGKVNPAQNENWAIRIACVYGHVEVVALLLKDKRVDPSDKKNSCIISACEEGQVEVVKLLLKDSKVNPFDDTNAAIFAARQMGYTEIVNLLISKRKSSKY